MAFLMYRWDTGEKRRFESQAKYEEADDGGWVDSKSKIGKRPKKRVKMNLGSPVLVAQEVEEKDSEPEEIELNLGKPDSKVKKGKGKK